MEESILSKFEFENLLINEYENWYLLLRKEQVTLGSLVLIEKSFKTNYSDISKESFEEFGKIVKEIESVLKNSFDYDKINYFMLMMVDNEVHYHIVPRYSKDVKFGNMIFKDFTWPGLPELKNKNHIDSEELNNILDFLKKEFGV